ncbi:abnormal cell migration protein 13-like [Stegodyphus dumicola]|uniref:abnormal cell migration protein 13-like n=1 Tax=Stegodyphus dumicola TaxID=202533 RepID=UPI0015AE6D53|nr:abnormal cell migration protein 13-like [Stegodyphus dumicola]
MKVLWNIISIVFLCAVCDASSLKTYYMNTAGNVITLPSASSGKKSSGILKSHEKVSYDTSNRTLTITAPYGLVASIRLLDLRPRCQDVLKLYEPSHLSNEISACNQFTYRSREEDVYERKKVYASSGTLIVMFSHTRGGSTFPYDGFQLTFTSVRNYPCGSHEFQCNNFKCISEKLTCDGHNHCGDSSDQFDCSRKMISPGKIIGIICGVVFLVIAAVCGCYIIGKRRMKNQTETTLIHQPAYPATYPQTAPYYPPPPPYTQVHNNLNYR